MESFLKSRKKSNSLVALARHDKPAAIPRVLSYATWTGERLRGFWAPLIAGATVAGVLVVYVVLISGGQLTDWQTKTYGFSMLADAFMTGQTSLLIKPSPELLQLADPYDPIQNIHVRLGDASLYKEKYYWYLGPIPALMLIPVKVWCDNYLTVIGDQYLVFVFVAGLLMAQTAIILRAGKAFYPGAPPWTLVPMIIALALALPVTWLIYSPGMLETAISGGQCFAFIGLYCAMTALPPGKIAAWKLLLAGIAWTLAVGCRLSLAPAIGVVALLTLWELARTGEIAWRSWRYLLATAALLLPLVAGAIGQGIYNRVRFESWTETGWTYQLAWMNHKALAGTGYIVSPRYILPNLYRYLLELPKIVPDPPYVGLEDGVHGLVRWFPPPQVNALERTAGMLWSAPFCLLALGAFWPRRRTYGMPKGAEAAPAPSPTAGTQPWLLRSLAALVVLGMAPVLCTIGSVERYLADGAPAVMLLAVLGAWRLLRRASLSAPPRWPAYAIVVLLSLLTATFGLLLVPW